MSVDLASFLGPRLRTKTGAAALSILSNSTLIVLKVGAGIVSGSVSILSEAIHSSNDLLAAVIAYFSVRNAAKPADERHRYGHGKLESISGTIEAILIFLAAALIIYEAVKRIITGVHLGALGLGTAVMLFSVVANFFVSRQLMRVAKATESLALEADAWHLTTDMYTSLGVFLGLVLVRLTGLEILDPFIAIGVALLIIKAAWDITRKSLADLLDTSLPTEEERKIVSIIQEHYGQYVEFHQLRSRKSGSSRHIDLHLVFPSWVSLKEAHTLSDHLEEEISRVLPNSHVVIHLEPETSEAVAEGVDVVERVKRVAAHVPVSVHHISAHQIKGRFFVDLHLEVDKALPLEEAHRQADLLEERVRGEIPNIGRIYVHIEPLEGLEEDVERASVEPQVVAAVKRVVAELKEIERCREVRVRRSEDGLFISLNCVLAGEESVERAHDIAEHLEELLRERIDGLHEVLVHLEPPAEKEA